MYSVHDLLGHAASYWTSWLDRDNPSGTGDWETYGSFTRVNPIRVKIWTYNLTLTMQQRFKYIHTEKMSFTEYS
jgi:hypothetical protein